MDSIRQQYRDILLHELLPALGCTEPIAIALACAKAREVLGVFPEHVHLYCSGNLIKNVRAVIVPNSGGRKGLEIAAALGIVGGDSDLQLEVLSQITDEQRQQAVEFVARDLIQVHHVKQEANLYLRVELQAGKDHAMAEIKYDHTRFNRVERNGTVLLDLGIETPDHTVLDLDCLNLEDIYRYADQDCAILSEEERPLREALEQQVEYNLAIGQEGIEHAHGSQVGRTLLRAWSTLLPEYEGIAYAAAGSDARMSGCSFPVVINSGSGNQGMTIAIPLAKFAQKKQCSKEKLLRALILANLIAVHEKRFIGKLSAFCGVVSASAATGAGLAYLQGMDWDQICKVITNTLATSGGMVCDGAKPSCAAKIGIALNTALMGIQMAEQGLSFQKGDGIVGEDAEETIRNVGRMARVGMQSTDEEILQIMIEKKQPSGATSDMRK